MNTRQYKLPLILLLYLPLLLYQRQWVLLQLLVVEVLNNIRNSLFHMLFMICIYSLSLTILYILLSMFCTSYCATGWYFGRCSNAVNIYTRLECLDYRRCLRSLKGISQLSSEQMNYFTARGWGCMDQQIQLLQLVMANLIFSVFSYFNYQRTKYQINRLTQINLLTQQLNLSIYQSIYQSISQSIYFSITQSNKVQISMQKQFKLIDEQLQINHLIRLPDPIPKPSNSFFRALSISIFSNHHETQYIKSIMKLTLQANCEAYLENIVLKKKKKHHIAFPIISQSSQLVKKYVSDKHMLQTYCHSPDLDCFQNDNYQLASFTFNRRVSVYYLNKDNYLNQTLISCCRNKRGRKIMLAKIGRRYFAVEKQTTRAIAGFVREFLLANVINNIISQRNSEKQSKVHFIAYDQIKLSSHNKKFPKIHKKSLSECGDINIMSKLQEFQEEEIDNENFRTNNMIKNNYDSVENRSHQEEPKNLLDRDLDFCDKEDRVVGDQEVGGGEGDMVTKEEIIMNNEQGEKQQQGKGQEVEATQQSQPVVQYQKQQPPLQIDSKVELTQTQTPTPITDQTTTYAYNYIDTTQQQQQQLQQPLIQQQTQYTGYYQPSQYMYGNYQYYPQQYSAYYNMNMHQMMYDPQQYYQYYQAQTQQQTEAYQYTQPESYQYTQQQAYQYTQPETYQFTQPQQLIQNNRYQGRLKFYDSNGKYGFIIVDSIGSDLFVHYDDLSKAGITKQQLQTHSASRQLRFQFTYYEYEGKNKKAKKAIDLLLLTQI